MTFIYKWAVKWGVPYIAIQDLMSLMGVGFDSPQKPPADNASEAAVLNVVRIEAARKGILLFRNNVGVLPDVTGRPVRYGLCNDSPELNKKIKSGDLIGINPTLITQAMVGSIIGQFVSREGKEAGWKFSQTPRELAQLKWANLILSKGGDAQFVTGEGSF